MYKPTEEEIQQLRDGKWRENEKLKEHMKNGIDLYDIDLTCADLKGAYLPNSDLTNACLEFANFTEANIVNTQFNAVKAENANFNKANLYESAFAYANLNNVNFIEAHLRHARFFKTDLHKTNFTYADLSHAGFYKDKGYNDTDFRHADLTEAKGIDLDFCCNSELLLQMLQDKFGTTE